MSAAAGRLNGAHAARRALDVIEAPAAAIASLCHAAAAWSELSAPLPAELVRPRDVADQLAAAVDALDAGDGDPAGTSRAAPRQRPAADRPRVRPARPPATKVPVDAPRRRPAPRVVTPPRSHAAEEDRAGAVAMSVAWERAGLAAVAPSAAPDVPSAPVAPRARLALRPLAGRDARADATPAHRGLASEPSPAGAASGPRGLAGLVSSWPADDLRPLAVGAVLAPITFRATAVASGLADLGANGSSAVAATSFPSAAAVPPAVDATIPAAAAAATAPRGLAGLATWWRDQDSGANRGTTTPPPPVTGEVIALASRRPADLDDVAAAPSSDRHAVGAFPGVDDVTRVLERVLVRELRRHGLSPEEP